MLSQGILDSRDVSQAIEQGNNNCQKKEVSMTRMIVEGNSGSRPKETHGTITVGKKEDERKYNKENKKPVGCQPIN